MYQNALCYLAKWTRPTLVLGAFQSPNRDFDVVLCNRQEAALSSITHLRKPFLPILNVTNNHIEFTLDTSGTTARYLHATESR